ncbi:MAG: hypothetical protein J5685_03275 [Clostridiales bacterium]|nr:hypothetical protein [Clostridiales bacterium]
MYTKGELNTKKKKDITASDVFLFALAVFVFSPLTAVSSMIGMVGDTCIQIRLGLDFMEQGRIITEEIYSWHPGLVFTAHECGWYFLMGLAYKLFRLWGVIAVGTVFNLGTAFLSVAFMRKKAHPFLIAAVLIITPLLNGFPDYNVRPSVVSAFLITLLITVSLSGKDDPIKAGIVFSVAAFCLGWMHGGILPLFFVVYSVFIVMDLLFREFKKAGIRACFLVIGALLSLLNPIGINTWLFGIRQSTATDIWVSVDEWRPMNFGILTAVLVLLFLIGMMCDPKVREFRKDYVTRLAFICMFFIMTCVYKRFVLYFSIAFMLFAPESFTALLSWINDKLFHIKKKVPSFSDTLWKILAVVCAVFVIGTGFMYIPLYLPTNSMYDIERMAAYDPGAAQFLREKGYQRVFNSFNTGSWLIFYGVPVHIDNRIDPYMSEFSGVDHIRGKMGLDDLKDLEDFRAEYDPDAILLDIPGGYSEVLEEIELYSEGRYRIVYDNTVVSDLSDDISIRWVILECI